MTGQLTIFLSSLRLEGPITVENTAIDTRTVAFKLGAVPVFLGSGKVGVAGLNSDITVNGAVNVITSFVAIFKRGKVMQYSSTGSTLGPTTDLQVTLANKDMNEHASNIKQALLRDWAAELAMPRDKVTQYLVGTIVTNLNNIKKILS